LRKESVLQRQLRYRASLTHKRAADDKSYIKIDIS